MGLLSQEVNFMYDHMKHVATLFKHFLSNFVIIIIRGFPKVDHSGIKARIVSERNKFTKKATSNRTLTLDPRTVVLTSSVQSHTFLVTELSGIFNSTFVCASIGFWT